MKASEALSISMDTQQNNLNYQRIFIIDKIRNQALYGKRELVVSYPHIQLFEDDYKYFEELGYSVMRPSRKELLPYGLTREEAIQQGKLQATFYFGMISW